MTKQLKKGLLTILLFVMSICCAFSVNSFATVKADAVDPFEKLNAYVEAFEVVDETEWLKNDLWDDYAGLKIEYNKLSAEQKETLTNKDAIDAVFAAYKAADEVVVSIEALGNFTIQSYTAGLARYNAVNSAYTALNDAEKAYVENNRLYANLAEFKGDIDELKAELNGIIDLIDAIEYRENDLFVEDGVYAPATSEIVLKSFDSIQAVTVALFGDAEDATDDIPAVDYVEITNLNNYYAAVEAYQDLLDDIADVEELIATLKARVDAKGVYTVGFYPVGSDSDIVLARKAFDALDDTADINNLQAEVENINVLVTIEADFAAVDTAVIAVEGLINAIPEVAEIRLIKAHFDLIVAAENAFDALPADVKANDAANYALETPVDANYMVSNYAKMCQTRAQYDELDGALNEYVDKLVSYDAAYKAAEAEHVLISDAAVLDLEFLRMYSYALNQDQIDTLEAKKFNETTSTWFDVYKMYTQDYSTNKENVNIFANSVNALVTEYAADGIVVVVVDDNNRIEDLIAAYVNELNALEKNWAQKYYLLLDNEDESALGLKQKFANDTKAITDWVAEVNKINAKVAVADFEQIVSVDATFTAWGVGSALQKVAMGGTYKVAYDKYQDALDEKTEIEGLIKSLTKSIKAVGARINLDYTFNAAGLNKFTTLVNAMKDAKAALDAKDDTAYASDYVGEKSRNSYDKNLVELEIFEVEIAIATLNAIANAHIVNLHIQISMILEDIADINVEVDALVVKPQTFRNLSVLNAAIDDVNDAIDNLVEWKAAVEDIAFETVEGYKVYQAKALADATKTYDGFENYYKVYEYAEVDSRNVTELKALPVMSVASVYAALQAKQTDSDAALKALEDEMNRLLAVAEGELNTIETEMKASQVAYNAFVAAGHEVNVDYAAFEAKLARLDFAKYFAQAVNTIAARVADEIYTFDDALMVDVLKAVYIASAGELQKLDDVVAAKAKLDELELVYDEKDLLDIDSVEDRVAELEDAVDALGGADKVLGDELDTLRDKYKTLNKSYKDFVKAANEFNGSWESLDKLVEQVKADVSVKVLEIETVIADLEDSLKCEIQKAAAKALADAKKYTDALANGSVANNAADIATNKAAIAAAKAAADKAQKEVDALELVVDAIDFIDEDELAAVIADAKAEIKNVTDALAAADAALADAIAKEEAARKAADEAIKADLKAAVEKLNKTITIITIILAIVSAACVGAIVYIFLKKRA